MGQATCSSASGFHPSHKWRELFPSWGRARDRIPVAHDEPEGADGRKVAQRRREVTLRGRELVDRTEAKAGRAPAQRLEGASRSSRSRSGRCPDPTEQLVAPYRPARDRASRETEKPTACVGGYYRSTNVVLSRARWMSFHGASKSDGLPSILCTSGFWAERHTFVDASGRYSTGPAQTVRVPGAVRPIDP